MELDLDNITSLEEFIFALGISAISIKTIHRLQSKALDDKYLETDEREAVETIRYELGRSLSAISSMLGLMGERGIININEVAERLQSRCKESIKKLHTEQ